MLDAMGVDADMAYRQARKFADNAAGAELNARQLFRVFRRQFSTTVEEDANDEYGNALAESYNANYKVRDRILHEHEVESYILMRIRNKAQVSAANFTRVSSEIRRGVTSFTKAVLSRALTNQQCAASTTDAIKAWRTQAAEQLRQCVIQIATKQAIGAKQNLLDVCLTLAPVILDATKALSKLADDLLELRARRPDIPLSIDLELVRGWDDRRIKPLMQWAESYARLLKDRWLILSPVSSITPEDHKKMMDLFDRINRHLHPDTRPLSPIKASVDGTEPLSPQKASVDGTEFLELRSKLTHQGHLRGRALHNQQDVLAAAQPPDKKDSSKAIESKPEHPVLDLTQLLDKYINTGLTPQVLTLMDRMVGIRASKPKIAAAVAAQRRSYKRMLQAVKPSSKEHVDLVLQEATRSRAHFDQNANQAEISKTRTRCRMLDLSVRVAQKLTTLSTRVTASAEASVTQAQAMDDLATVWADSSPHMVHQKMVDIAERRSRRILMESGVHVNISDARVRAIQNQIQAVRTSNRLKSNQMKEWYDVIALAEADANDSNGGERLRKCITDLLPIRARAVDTLTIAVKELKNVSEVVLTQLERRVATKKRTYIAQMGHQSEMNAEAKLEHVRLEEEMVPKSRAVEDLEVRLAENKRDLAEAEKNLKDAQSGGSDSLQPDEVLQLSDVLAKHQQSNKQIVANLEAARAAVAAQQKKLDAVRVEVAGSEAKREKAFRQWMQRLDKSMVYVRTMLRGLMSKLNPHVAIMNSFHPPTPVALEKVIGSTLPPAYPVAYSNVRKLTRVIEQATLKIRVANVLRNKLGLAKAYRDSEDLRSGLVQIREGMQSSTVLRETTELVPILTQAIKTFAANLHTVLRAQISASYLHEMDGMVAVDARLSAPIPSLMNKARQARTVERKIDKTLTNLRETSTRVQAKLKAAKAKLADALAKTTHEEEIADQMHEAQLNKTAHINAMLKVHEEMEATNASVPELTKAIKGYLGRRALLQRTGRHLERRLLAQQAKTKTLCAAAERVVSQMESLTEDEKVLLGMSSKNMEQELAPCEEAKEEIENIENKQKKNAGAIEKAKADLATTRQQQANAVQAVIDLGRKSKNMRGELKKLATTQAEKEEELEQAKRHSAKFVKIINDAKDVTKRYSMRDDSITTDIGLIQVKLGAAKNIAHEALVKVSAKVDEQAARQREIQKVKASHLAYRTSNDDGTIQIMAEQADEVTEISARLVKLLGTLRDEQTKATDTRMGLIRQLAQSMVNAFACTGCKAMDTNVVYERPPSDTSIDENQGEGWTDKLALQRLYKEFISKANKFNSLPIQEEAAWKASAQVASKLAKVMHLDILRSAEPAETILPVTKKK